MTGPLVLHGRGQVAQLVEQRTENPRVGGSIPSLAIRGSRRKVGKIRERRLSRVISQPLPPRESPPSVHASLTTGGGILPLDATRLPGAGCSDFASVRSVPSSSASPRLSHATSVLTSAPFGLAVALLVLNDWILKAAIGNWVTGKLSDIAGLAAFSMFWAAVFSRQRRAVFLVTGAAFVFWKSPLSEAALQAWNALALWPLARVVDYSDLLALGVLPLTYRLLCQMERREAGGLDHLARRVRALATGVAAIVAFTATSILHPIPLEEAAYAMPAARDEVLAALDSIRAPLSDRPKKRGSSSADTLVVYVRHPPERWLRLTIEVRDQPPSQSEIRPIFISPTAPAPSAEGLRRAFIAQVVQPLREWFARRGSE
jgi:hypothetical protein